MQGIAARLRRLEEARPSTDVADLTDAELSAEVNQIIARMRRDGPPELRRRLAEADGRDEQVALLLETPAD